MRRSSQRAERGEGEKRRRGAALVAVLSTLAFAGACGSASGDSLFGKGGGTGGDGGGGSGGEPADAGASGSSADGGRHVSGGAQSSGGVTPGAGGERVTGGAASSGGAAADSGAGGEGSGGALPEGGASCRAPSSPAESALCLHFIPERIRARADRQLDKLGSLIVTVFDGPIPEDGKGEKLAERVLTDPSEISVDALPVIEFVEAFPDTVYVRAVFVDNPSALAPGESGHGLWIGGVDLTKGVVDPQALLPVPLTPGAAQDIDMPLVALRRLQVALPLQVTPLGDGEGPLLVTAVRTPTPSLDTSIQGLAGAGCAKPTGGSFSLTGFVIGSGTFYLGALLNDLGGTGTVPPGSIASLDTSTGAARLSTRLLVAPTDYAVKSEVPLNHVVPTPSDPIIPPNSCADLGL